MDTYVGQSVQVRKNADGLQNSDLANFRWTVTQVNAESLNNLDVSVPLPMAEAPGLRSLTGKGNSATEVDGGVLYEFPDVYGVQTKRTLNLWPQDQPLQVDVTAEFTLDGEKVSAQDIVGKGGLVTATYTIVNQSVKTEEVQFENVAGEPDTEEVETSQAFVGISKQFIPQSWAQFDPGNGIFGADGRGNYQTQWISLAFLPFAEDGKASFGWSAVVPEGEGFIPKIVIEVSPLYVPTHQPEEEEQGAESSNGVPQPNMDAATASVQSGVEDLVLGVEGLTSALGKTKGEIKEGVSIAASQVTAAVDELCAPELLDCDAPEPEDPLELSEVIAALDQAIAAIDAYLASGGGDAAEVAAVLEEIETELNNALAEATAAVAKNTTALEFHTKGMERSQSALDRHTKALELNQKALTVYEQTAEAVGCGPSPEGGTVVACPELDAAIAETQQAIAETEQAIAEDKEAIADHQAGIDEANAALDGQAATIAILELAQQKVNEAQDAVGDLGNLSTDALNDLKKSLTRANDLLKGIQAELDLLAPPLADLNAGLDAIGAAIDSGLTNLSGAGASLDQIASGKAQVSAGLGQASDDVKAYIAEVVALAQATAEEAGDAAAEAEAQLNTVKAEMAGLLGRMAESPLPYGGGFNTAYAPAGDTQAVTDASIALLPNDEPVEETDGVVHTAELFGAYQFMLDPADRARPTVPWRIALALILVIGAGLLGTRLAKRTA